MARITDPAVLLPRARGGDRRALARLITLVEDARPEGDAALAEVYRDSGTAWTTGLTGAPGAGKSTLTDRLIGHLRATDTEVAAVAVDPSSPFTGGAILGDRVRMQGHIDDSGVYIRSMASRGHLGGIASATPRVVTFLDGIGFPEILIETVGVGQAEVEIAASADTTLVVLNPGWGDSIQAAKAGLLEIGDVFIVNKADRPGTNETIRDLKQMLELGGHGDWWPPVLTTIGSTGEGTAEVLAAIREHRTFLEQSGRLETVRRERVLANVRDALELTLQERVRQTFGDHGWESIRTEVVARRLDPWSAARHLLDHVAAQ
jgi:LAO/AO transport system kinase